MRWDDLFADLEVDAAGLEQRDRDAEIADRTRAELGRIALIDRCRAAAGYELQVRVHGFGVVTGTLRRATSAWLLLEAAGGVDWLVAGSAVVGIIGLPTASRAPDNVSHVEARAGWGSALRVLARDRASVVVHRLDATSVSGVAQRVGADFVELRRYADEARTSSGFEAVPYTAIAAILIRAS
ncbi:MAG: hypothetical protein ACRDP1_00755 [Nocardioidaceae bacterium]